MCFLRFLLNESFVCFCFFLGRQIEIVVIHVDKASLRLPLLMGHGPSKVKTLPDSITIGEVEEWKSEAENVEDALEVVGTAKEVVECVGEKLKAVGEVVEGLSDLIGPFGTAIKGVLTIVEGILVLLQRKATNFESFSVLKVL